LGHPVSNGGRAGPVAAGDADLVHAVHVVGKGLKSVHRLHMAVEESETDLFGSHTSSVRDLVIAYAAPVGVTSICEVARIDVGIGGSGAIHHRCASNVLQRVDHATATSNVDVGVSRPGVGSGPEGRVFALDIGISEVFVLTSVAVQSVCSGEPATGIASIGLAAIRIAGPVSVVGGSGKDATVALLGSSVDTTTGFLLFATVLDVREHGIFPEDDIVARVAPVGLVDRNEDIVVVSGVHDDAERNILEVANFRRPLCGSLCLGEHREQDCGENRDDRDYD